MRTITLEEHFLTDQAINSTIHLRDSDPTAAYRDLIQDKLLDLGDGRIADMDAAGIDLQVLSLAVCGVEELAPAAATELSRGINDRLAAGTRAYPDRLAGFATLALQEPEKAAAEFDRCVTKLGFKGAFVNGATNGLFLDHPRFTPLLEVAQSLDVPIYLHPAPPPRPVRDAYYTGLPGQLGDFLSTGAWGWHVETGMHSLQADRFRCIRSLSETKNHHRAHGGKPALFNCARRFCAFSSNIAPEAQSDRLFSRAFLCDYKRILHAAPIPMCSRGGRRGPASLFRRLSVRAQFGRPEIPR